MAERVLSPAPTGDDDRFDRLFRPSSLDEYIGQNKHKENLKVFVEAAELADALGDADALTQAAIGASWRYTQPPGIVDAELIALLERAIAATEGQATVARVLLLARLCGALYYSPRRDEMAALSQACGPAVGGIGCFVGVVRGDPPGGPSAPSCTSTSSTTA